MKLAYGAAYTSNNEKLHKCWYHYFCLPVQIILLIFICSCLVMVSIGYMNVNLMIRFGGSPEPSPSDPTISINEKQFSRDVYWSSAAAVTEQEETDENKNEKAREIFDEYDVNADELLSKEEFGNYIKTISNVEESFDYMDPNQDNKIYFHELLTVFKIIDSTPSLQTTQLIDTMMDMFGELYTIERKPIFLCEIFFQQMDKSKNNVITKDEYIQYEIDAEWTQYNVNDDGFITFESFAETVFESVTNKELNNFETMKADGTFNPEQTKKEYDELVTTNEGKSRTAPEFEPHELDEQIEAFLATTDSEVAQVTRRRLLFLAAAVTVAIVVVGIVVWGFIIYWGVKGVVEDIEAEAARCYDENSYVNVFGEGLQKMRHVKVGDYVYDGSEYTKIFYVSGSKIKSKMNKIEYGNPNDDNYIVLSPIHLLYKYGHEFPVRSEDISVGDRLEGLDICNHNQTHFLFQVDFDCNYTVYNTSNVYATPITPYTNSGLLMVNDGIKTSVYSHSILIQFIVIQVGIIFRWISDNVDQDIAVNMIDFCYEIVYKNMKYFMNTIGVYDTELITEMMVCILLILGLFVVMHFVRKIMKFVGTFGVTNKGN